MILEKTDDRVKSKYKRPTVNKELAQKMQEQEKVCNWSCVMKRIKP